MQPLPAGMPSLQQSKALPPDLATPVEILALPHVFSVVTAANLPALQVRSVTAAAHGEEFLPVSRGFV